MSLFILVQSKGIQNCVGKLIHLGITLAIFQFLNNDDALFIDRCDKVFALAAKETLHTLHGTVIFFLLQFQNHNNTANICINMKFLRTIINIYQKKVIKKEILDKAVFVKSFFICNDQILDLKCCKLANHISVFIVTMCHKYIFQLVVITDFKILESLHELAVCLGFHKCLYIPRLN